MVSVVEQYDVYPYPERDPEDERRRLITGSPSHPAEMDHFLWGGRRDWTRPLRALVAGGGTGDALIQLAQVLTNAGRPYEIVYLDLSPRARGVAEARASVRGLTGIRYETGSLLDATGLGPFDYIDCCGVLHHLPDPAEGFTALRGALAPRGGMGFMVYAPYGRSGVYPLQEAFNTILDGPPETRLSAAREIVAALPDGHPFKRNANLVDHAASDAGFYDLLLHSRDRAFDVSELLGVLEATGWQLASFTMPGLYDLANVTRAGADLPLATRMAVAEKLNGTIKTHIGYAVAGSGTPQVATGRDRARIPNLRGAEPHALSAALASGKAVPLRVAGGRRKLALPQRAARLIAQIDGRRPLSDIAAGSGLDPIAFGTTWSQVEAALAPWGLLVYSGLWAGKAA